jgi:glycosyltransferase involved in cell wall biosynthesis
MLTGREIICLSTQDWRGLWTRKQRFMHMFAGSGNRVLYIETPVHLLGLDVLPRDLSRFWRFLKGPRPIEPNLHAATLPILLPFFQMGHSINAANHVIVVAMLRRWMRSLDFRKPLLWLYTPFSEAVVRGLDHSASVYECVDEFRAARGFVRANVIGAMEDSLLRQVDVTFVTQENLLPRRAALCKNTFCVPNGADVESFRRAMQNGSRPSVLIENLPRPRLAFVGHLQYWIDLELIRYLAERRPAWSIVLIGPVAPFVRADALRKLRNVHFLGRQPQSEIPFLLKGVDLCLNPYITGELADHCSPLKLYEYMAAGKPIVSTEMPEAHKFPNDIVIGQSYEDFLKKCDAILARLPESASVVQRRIDSAGAHSWENRFRTVNGLIEQSLQWR